MKETGKKKSVFRRILNAVASVVAVAAILILAFVVISNLRGDVTFIAGKTVVWVKTGSMEPTIPEQSYALMERADPKTLEVGDVILFHSDDPTLGGELNTHRIVEIVGDHEEFVTRGDNNLKEDDYTAKADKVVAVYERTLPFLSSLGRFMSTKAGLFTVIFLILAIMAAIYVPDLVVAARDKKAEDEKKKQEEEKKRQEEIDARVRAEVERLKAESDPGQEPKPTDDSKKEEE